MEPEQLNLLANTLADLKSRSAEMRGCFDFDLKSKKLEEVRRALEDPQVWGDPARAQELGKEKKALEGVVGTLTGLDRGLHDSDELFALARADADDATLGAVRDDVAALAKTLEGLEFRRMFSHPMDPSPCFVDVQAGSGGTEAQDWASMLLRMYLRYCERRGWSVEVLEESPGDVAGIKSASLKVDGDYAYGYLRTETGVHRLVRKSPFDSNARRHTSFASVFVYPEVDDSIAVEINPADLRVDTFRASGAGGQHINKTDSAVRITHLPTGLVVECQDDRSQHKNKASALKVLAARLKDAQLREQQSKEAATRKSLIGSGDRSERIRTYNFPQGRVTDHRINLTLYKLPQVITGEALGELVDALTTEHQAAQLAAQGAAA
ncbi:MAG TPA: peptide chain release factor 2 [Casimicrobiaceae bacterium]|nr:peptide chain release factor 2 [Casimicrobiaceae bacterium]